MNRLTIDKPKAVVAALVEGCSVRSVCRMTGVAKGTVLKLLADIGRACEDYQRRTLVNLNCRRIQCDEIWSFCYAKQKNRPASMRGKPGVGDVWTWTAIDADSKLIVSWLVGGRDSGYAHEFMQDIAGRLATRVQLTTDGHKPYLEAVEGAFGADIDYSMLIELNGAVQAGEARYSPPKCTGTIKKCCTGNPNPAHVSTSYVERQNLTMRMSMRRFTRLTNAFSKKAENLEAAVALYFLWYNFGRIHQTLRVTPAMAAGVSGHVWELDDVIGLLEAQEKEVAAN